MAIGNIPSWAEKLLSVSEAQQISETIAEMEKKTDGEIVTMIVKKSSSIGQVPILLFLIFSLAILATDFALYLEGYNQELWHWFSFSFFIASLPLSFWLARFLCVQRWLTAEADEVAQVQARAQLEFFNHGVHKTEKQTGILLFISLMERKAVVLGDQGIASLLPPQTWQELVQIMIIKIKEDQPAQGLLLAVKTSGELLAKHFPTSHHKNELENHLIIKE